LAAPTSLESWTPPPDWPHFSLEQTDPQPEQSARGKQKKHNWVHVQPQKTRKMAIEIVDLPMKNCDFP